VAFEQSADIGGTWVYRNEIGQDKFGLNVHSSMYKDLVTDIPKEVMSYPDFPYSTTSSSSYISHTDVLNYLNAYAKTFKLYDRIKFEHSVVRIHPLSNDTWEVLVKNLASNAYKTYVFDSVLVCTGNFHTPAIPILNGRALFNGIQLHSHEFREKEQFTNKSVLIIGAGPSGIDLVQSIAKVAKSVKWSTHAKTMNIKLPENVSMKSDVKQLTTSGAIFTDDTMDEVDVIIYCTGYIHSFPFLSVDCDVAVEENFISPLYKHCLCIKRPSLGFIGLPTFVCKNQVFDFQARFCLKFMMKKLKKLPSREEMLRDYESDMAARWERGLTKRTAHLMGFDTQEKYFEELAEVGELEHVKPVIMKIFNKSIRNLLANLNDFRARSFRILDDENFEEL
jgi:hypothetical protein